MSTKKAVIIIQVFTLTVRKMKSPFMEVVRGKRRFKLTDPLLYCLQNETNLNFITK